MLITRLFCMAMLVMLVEHHLNLGWTLHAALFIGVVDILWTTFKYCQSCQN